MPRKGRKIREMGALNYNPGQIKPASFVVAKYTSNAGDQRAITVNIQDQWNIRNEIERGCSPSSGGIAIIDSVEFFASIDEMMSKYQ